MRQVVTTANGGVEVLKVQEATDPTPAKGEVVVQVKAAGLNFADILARQGLYPDGPRKPCVMGYEVAGVIETVGEDVDHDMVGKAVVAMTRFRGQAEKVAVAANQLFAKPELCRYHGNCRTSRSSARRTSWTSASRSSNPSTPGLRSTSATRTRNGSSPR